MATKDEAIKAVETLKEWCIKNNCESCPFFIAGVGCIEVHRLKYNPIVLWRAGDYQGDLPILAFQYLDPGESVAVDTIIQEAKED